MKTIKAKVHRLPTEDSSCLHHIPKMNMFTMTTNPARKDIIAGDEYVEQQHLYITTDEEIKEGDWFINTGSGGHPTPKVYQANSENSKAFKEFGPYPEIRKIIASTDPKLNSNQIEPYDTSKPYGIEFPQIPQSFIEEYCKVGGIDEVLVEYEILGYKSENIHIGVKGTDIDVELPNTAQDKTQVRLKLNPDNTIIIHPVKEKMYSRDEIGNKIKEFVKEYAYEWSMDDINEWIEENL
jgi:hypothetical protein